MTVYFFGRFFAMIVFHELIFGNVKMK